ncbi:sodium:proton exchanger [Salipiger aestuarii]|uniref:Cation:H+ antiporter n=1 Tax=Salipiger aestuarii TaxID=568098 RepID=A0A327YGF8_9RHOB|nr:calcium/sodium antiporter [Salipiger aestuarii]EIE51539.1 K+-dependent Na+/Ca+ exchanger family protein [Citreicella sp. 357]KAA8608448.1 sodium:proton exchanger [Salipiger aestuarii]KAA8612275.1 sodium:proton exchanger [Salipiger aestuarii]KAB2541407.1 sodium:proton exchanger [Salipiger aestuarii]RAK20060.1 cation:H+ antiporter [Salipiger aestuarii]
MVFVYAAVGLVILLLAGDALVKGAVNLSLRVGIPALMVSLTIVAFGTSAPELLISIQAAMRGVPGIALGNVVGSNTANALLVMGIPALIAVMHTSGHDTRKSYVIMIAATLFFIALAFRGIFDLWAGLALLAALALALGDSVREALYHRRGARTAVCDAEDPEGADPDMPWWKIVLFLVLGLIGLPLGANLLVESATEIAGMFGVSDTVIGLTLVALGTSLPELATTVMAAIRRQADVALGNVIGSNMFNLLAIIGVASLIKPMPVAPEFLSFDLWVMLASSLLLIPFVFLKQDLGRVWGAILTALYVGYIVAVLI